jgi:hypothetical protein
MRDHQSQDEKTRKKERKTHTHTHTHTHKGTTHHAGPFPVPPIEKQKKNTVREWHSELPGEVRVRVRVRVRVVEGLKGQIQDKRKVRQDNTRQDNIRQHKTTQDNTGQHRTTYNNILQDKTRQDTTREREDNGW